MTAAPEWIVVGLLRASFGLAVAALAVAACVRLLRPRAPRAEQWAWLFVLAQGVILFPVAIPVPSRFWGPVMHPRPAPIAASPPGRLPGPEGAARGAVVRDTGDRPASGPGLAVEPPPAMDRPRGSFTISWPPVVSSAWLAGILAFLAVGLLRYRSFARRMLAARPASAEWQAEWRQVLDEHTVRVPIPMVVSPDVGPALCWTASGHRLVVPGSTWAELAASERAAILRHELEHYRRGDLRTTLLARGLALLHWFNPLAWWAAARFEAQSEFLCDRASVGDDPPAFAALLLRLGSGRPERFGVVQSAGNGGLCERIERLLDDASATPRWKRALPIAVAVAALGAMAVRLQAVGVSGMSAAGQGDQAKATGPRPPLPPRALVQLGTSDLRIRSAFITEIAFAPDDRLIAAAEANTEFPRISVFDVRSGRLVKTIEPTVKPKGWVHCLAFSPDGTKLLWGEVMGQVALWDLAHDTMLFRERFHGGGGLVKNLVVDEAAYSGTVNQVAFSPDGRLVASAGIDGYVRVRQIDRPAATFRDFKTPWSATGRPNRMGGDVLRPNPGLESARCMAFTPDGTRLVIGSGNTISVWRIADGQLIRRIERAHGDRPGARNPGVDSLAVTPDGRHVLSTGHSTVPPNLTSLKGLPENVRGVALSEVRLWDIASGERVRDLGGGEHHGTGSAALSRDGRRLVVADRDALRILDAATGQVERTIALTRSGGARPAISPDGAIVAQSFGNTIGLFDVASGRRLLHDERMPWDEPISAAWSPAGDRVVAGYRDGGVRVWDVASGKLAWHRSLGPAATPMNSILIPNFVAFARGGRFVVAAGGADTRYGRLAIYDAMSGRLVREVEQPEITEAALSPDGRIVVAATSPSGSGIDKQLRGIEVDTGRTRWTSPAVGEKGGWLDLRWMQFRPDSSLLELAQGTGDVIRLNALTGRELRRSRFDWRPRDQQKPAPPAVLVQLFGYAAFSDDARTLASFAEKSVSVWDVETGTLRRRIPHPDGDGRYMAVSPDGKVLATSVRHDLEPPSEDQIGLYDIDTGELVRTLEPADDRAAVLVFSPDGNRLFAGFHRGTAIIWDVRRAE